MKCRIIKHGDPIYDDLTWLHEQVEKLKKTQHDTTKHRTERQWAAVELKHLENSLKDLRWGFKSDIENIDIENDNQSNRYETERIGTILYGDADG